MSFRTGLVAGSLWGATLALSFTSLLLLTAAMQLGIRVLFGLATPYDVNELPLGPLVLAYFAGGISAGAALGLLLPRARGVVPAALAATFAAILFVTAVRIAIYGLSGWTAADLLGVHLRAWLIGACGALVVWASSRYRQRTRGSR